MRWIALMFAAVSVVSCGKDGRCTPSNCEKMSTSCRIEIAGTATYRACARAGLMKDPAVTKAHAAQSCADACLAGGSGEITQCIADLAPQCEMKSDAERVDFVLSSCSRKGGGGPADPACDKACSDKLLECDNACPTTSFKECGDCSSKCGLDWIACNDRC